MDTASNQTSRRKRVAIAAASLGLSVAVMPGTSHAQAAAAQPPSDIAGKDTVAKVPAAVGTASAAADNAAPVAAASSAAATRRAAATASGQGGSSATNGIPMTVNVVSRSSLDQQQPSDSYEALRGAAGISVRSRRTTGGSTVEDALRTNSPISWSLVMTTLLSTPSSFASS